MRGVPGIQRDQVELLAIAKADSQNAKTGKVAVTYAAQASCPTSCAFFNGGGCYAENGIMASGVTGPLNHAAAFQGATWRDVALAEARAVDELELVPGQPMRLHSVGDCRTDEAARIVSAAAERYMERGGGQVWTYTHAWQIVGRASWGKVSVFASCESAAHVELARMRGYTPSIVVADFASRKRHVVDGVDVLPCPAQTVKGVTCASCRLCLDDRGIMERGYAIAFEVHGTSFSVKQARKALAAPHDSRRRVTSRIYINEFRVREGRWPSTHEVQVGVDIGWASAREMLDRMKQEAEE